eukprot:m.10120 g.10120  ORF g.10120 m.10120 type:complete len:572 (-) comp2717_c0_seq1:1775-3490(-)
MVSGPDGRTIVCVVVTTLLVTAAAAPVPPSTQSAKVWYRDSDGTPFTYPESTLTSLANKTDSAIVFTGGGVRSYTCTMGYLAGLLQAGLLDKPKYIGGVSGGSWAVSTYVYAQLGTKGVAATDEELLCGPVTPPGNLSMTELKHMSPTCARASGNIPLGETFFSNLADPSIAWTEVWSRTVSQIYLETMGIAKDAYFSYDTATVADVTQRNPSLANAPFVLPQPGRPFMVVGTTLLGPDGALENRSWIGNEGTALYFGQPHVQNVTYTIEHFRDTKRVTFPVGGFIEPWAVGSTLASGATRPAASGDVVKVHPSPTPFRLRELIGMSSFVIGGAISRWAPELSLLTPRFATWPRDVSSTREPNLTYADGGCVENLPIIPMLRRRVKRIVAFINAEGSLAPASVWNPATDKYRETYMDDYVPGYFGVVPPAQVGYYTGRDQVFPTSDFAPVVSALQAAMATGKGAIATTNHTTVANAWWGVDAGITVTITWVYLTRMSAWEGALPASLQSHVVPTHNPTNPQSLPTSGPFVNFPHFDDVEQPSLTPAQANLLAEMTGWTVGANLDTFAQALS